VSGGTHHVVVHVLQSEGVGVDVFPHDGAHGAHGWGLVTLHPIFVVYETIILVYLSREMRSEAEQSGDLVEVARRRPADASTPDGAGVGPDHVSERRAPGTIGTEDAVAASRVGTVVFPTRREDQTTPMSEYEHHRVERYRHHPDTASRLHRDEHGNGRARRARPWIAAAVGVAIVAVFVALLLTDGEEVGEDSPPGGAPPIVDGVGDLDGTPSTASG
jgi:hypothetical protein